MTIEEAAVNFGDEYSEETWFVAVGIGKDNDKPCITVYVKSRPKYVADLFKDGWEGFSVIVKKSGSVNPCGFGN